MDKQLKYVLSGIGIAIPALIIGSYLPQLAKDNVAWLLLICLISAGIITLIVELLVISQKMYAGVKAGTGRSSLLTGKEK